jgi:hypothetical protein
VLAGVQAQDGRPGDAEFQCRKALIILAEDEKRNNCVTSGAVPRAVITYMMILDMLGLSEDQIVDRVRAIRDGKDPGPVPKPKPPSKSRPQSTA